MTNLSEYKKLFLEIITVKLVTKNFLMWNKLHPNLRVDKFLTWGSKLILVQYKVNIPFESDKETDKFVKQVIIDWSKELIEETKKLSLIK